MKELLDKASAAYYNGNPTLSDAEFDKLSSAFGYSSVGYHEAGGVTLPFSMTSLVNVFEGEELPLSEFKLTHSPKLDGAAVALVYIYGELRSIITRGNGTVGKDISHLIPVFPVPKIIPLTGIVQVTGELVAPTSVPRARNYAAGALGLKSPSAFEEREVTFVAYGLFPFLNKSFSTDMHYLNQQVGFNTVLDFDATNFPCDGVVYRIDDYTKFTEAGYTSHHPKGAFALKKNKQGVITTLLDVEWQVGKSGVVSPVAILEPVELDEVMISRATLHNMKYIRLLELEIGCKVNLIRAGDVIPRITGRAS